MTPPRPYHQLSDDTPHQRQIETATQLATLEAKLEAVIQRIEDGFERTACSLEKVSVALVAQDLTLASLVEERGRRETAVTRWKGVRAQILGGVGVAVVLGIIGFILRSIRF